MPINFSDLVDKIEQRNLQNRQQTVAQMKPFLDVITRKATYEMEKRKAAEETAAGLAEAAKTIGIDYTPNTSLTPDMQKFTFNLEADSQAPRKQWEAFSSVYGVQIPENLKDMTPEQATVSLAKAKEDYSTSEAVNDTLSLYPELAQKLMADPKFSQADAKLKRAMLDKELGDEAAKQTFAQKLAMKKIETDENIRQYWSTTGALAREKMKQDAEGTTTSTQNKKQQDDTALMRKMETSGFNFGTHNVKVKFSKSGEPVAETTTTTDRLQKTPLGIYYLKNNKWLPLKMKDKDGKVSYRGKGLITAEAIKDLSAGYTAYEKAALSGGEPQPATTNSDLDWLFGE